VAAAAAATSATSAVAAAAAAAVAVAAAAAAAVEAVAMVEAAAAAAALTVGHQAGSRWVQREVGHWRVAAALVVQPAAGGTVQEGEEVRQRLGVVPGYRGLAYEQKATEGRVEQ